MSQTFEEWMKIHMPMTLLAYNEDIHPVISLYDLQACYLAGQASQQAIIDRILYDLKEQKGIVFSQMGEIVRLMSEVERLNKEVSSWKAIANCGQGQI